MTPRYRRVHSGPATLSAVEHQLDPVHVAAEVPDEDDAVLEWTTP